MWAFVSEFYEGKKESTFTKYVLCGGNPGPESMQQACWTMVTLPPIQNEKLCLF